MSTMLRPAPPDPLPVAAMLRTLGVVAQTGLAGLSLLVLLFLSAFVDEPEADSRLILTVLAIVAAWCAAEPVLFAFLTRTSRSVGNIAMAFLACGPVPFLAYVIVQNVP